MIFSPLLPVQCMAAVFVANAWVTLWALPLELLRQRPEYAGLLEVGELGCVREVHRAPRLHSHKVPVFQLQAMGRGLMWRYWNERGA